MSGVSLPVKWSGYFILLILALLPVLVQANDPSPGSIVYTKHNLSGSLSRWPAPSNSSVKAVYEPEICIFCHTPHNTNPVQPLWNHELSSVQTYKVYWSNTIQSYSEAESQTWKVDGYSKLCLSCHDGTIAVGSVNSRWDEILMTSSNCVDASGRLVSGEGCSGYIGTDLSGGHPISIVYNQALVTQRNNNSLVNSRVPTCKLNSPPSNNSYVRTYPTENKGGGSGVQCTSCHNPHTNRSMEEDTNGVKWPPFWQGVSYNAVCEVCHYPDCGSPDEIWPW